LGELVPGVRDAQSATGGQDVKGHVVGAGVQVGADPVGDRVHTAPGDHGVDQSVAAARYEIRLAETETLETGSWESR
jgi:hypothetical protein